ncbi:MAG TPA: NADH-quinone oxidoreductase subunit H [bacterium]|nr:NADH-quinone oxidoreductase subunit H [bacterium]
MTARALNVLFLLIIPFLMAGVINRVKALAGGRKGPPLLQPFFDTLKLLRKGAVVSRVTSWVFAVAPALVLAATATALLLAPGVGRVQTIAFDGDIVLCLYLLGLAKFFQLISALDTGSAFEGMGASREALFSVIVEPSLFLFAGTLALVSGTTSFGGLFTLVGSGAWPAVAATTGTLLFFMLMLTEGCRIPVDDPNTHLELTMIHEVMILDNSGPDLAFLQYAAALKMYLFALLIAALVLPVDIAPFQAAVVLPLVALLCALLAGIVESLVARFRISHVPQFLFLTVALALIALAAAVYFRGGAV